jgi:hypothetical protein
MKGKDHSEDIFIHRRIILKKDGGRVGIGFIWPRTLTSEHGTGRSGYLKGGGCLD